MAETKPFLTYKGRPLVRTGNMIFYGNLTDRCVVMMQILATQKQGDEEIATKISLQLQTNDPEVKPAERVIRTAEKTSMADAVEIATIWLDRADEEEVE